VSDRRKRESALPSFLVKIALLRIEFVFWKGPAPAGQLVAGGSIFIISDNLSVEVGQQRYAEGRANSLAAFNYLSPLK
jgi:hypothetical protein